MIGKWVVDDDGGRKRWVFLRPRTQEWRGWSIPHLIWKGYLQGRGTRRDAKGGRTGRRRFLHARAHTLHRTHSRLLSTLASAGTHNQVAAAGATADADGARG